jgi:hypothetical protein
MNVKQTHQILKIFTFSIASTIIGAPMAFAQSTSTSCGGVNTSVINCNNPNGVMGVLMLIVNILSAGIVIAAIGGIAYASVMYTTSGGSPDKVKQAKTIITNVVIGLVAYAFLWSFLNYITPGGMFN